MIVGCLCYAASLGVFLIPNEIVGGGVSGAASLIQIITGLPAGIFIVLINVPILIFGFRLMGWKFIIRCFITTATLGLCTESLKNMVKQLDQEAFLIVCDANEVYGKGFNRIK